MLFVALASALASAVFFFVDLFSNKKKRKIGNKNSHENETKQVQLNNLQVAMTLDFVTALEYIGILHILVISSTWPRSSETMIDFVDICLYLFR